ncbi:hypothetical protein AVEN_229922-1 [Araneus ventricosus]|uniref:Uncharacterized protein n=1 Tax=Araneus ventricosus TaxID=182803 RepID=A0A4Y2BWM3_ARAVE|nr:hypothetical protein AVEN_229922-1 [Araneus ventricosus]
MNTKQTFEFLVIRKASTWCDKSSDKDSSTLNIAISYVESTLIIHYNRIRSIIAATKHSINNTTGVSAPMVLRNSSQVIESRIKEPNSTEDPLCV